MKRCIWNCLPRNKKTLLDSWSPLFCSSRCMSTTTLFIPAVHHSNRKEKRMCSYGCWGEMLCCSLDTSVPHSATFQYQFQPGSNWGCGRKFEPSTSPPSAESVSRSDRAADYFLISVSFLCSSTLGPAHSKEAQLKMAAGVDADTVSLGDWLGVHGGRCRRVCVVCEIIHNSEQTWKVSPFGSELCHTGAYSMERSKIPNGLQFTLIILHLLTTTATLPHCKVKSLQDYR